MRLCSSACGECGRCRKNRRAGRLLQQALLLLEVARWDMTEALHANSEADVKAHPSLRRKVGLLARIEKLVRQADAE